MAAIPRTIKTFSAKYAVKTASNLRIDNIDGSIIYFAGSDIQDNP
jgi:hypothetical protein